MSAAGLAFPPSGIARDASVELFARTLVPDSPDQGDSYFKRSGQRLLEGVSHYLLGRIDDSEQRGRYETVDLAKWEGHTVSPAMLLDFIVARVGLWLRSDEPTVIEDVQGIIDEAHDRSLSRKIDRGLRPLLGMAPRERRGVLKTVEEAVADLKGQSTTGAVLTFPRSGTARDAFVELLVQTLVPISPDQGDLYFKQSSQRLLEGVSHYLLGRIDDSEQKERYERVGLPTWSGHPVSTAMLLDFVMSRVELWIRSDEPTVIKDVQGIIDDAHDRSLSRKIDRGLKPLLGMAPRERRGVLKTVEEAVTSLRERFGHPAGHSPN